ncbi:hypothetical protein EB795_31725 [Pseudomonas mandelii]|uniref:hypothetical protein n=1 Tax=Pseudomonas mandelii TaxID=75612 RepID=UPI0012B19ECC|nr:hypothetical protein [Pseudomonas mandelii]MSU98435.1 hypothetical protein [Pseudomonas mandelii]
MIEQPISPEDEARYMQVMAGYDAAMREHYQPAGPVPMCHFKRMTQHWSDAHPASDSAWYECDHCGHSESSAEAWAKVKARQAKAAAFA